MIKHALAIAATSGALLLASVASAQAAPCSYFGSHESDAGNQGICGGGVDVGQSIANAADNLKKNLTLTGGLNLGNLQHAATHGVGTDG